MTLRDDNRQLIIAVVPALQAAQVAQIGADSDVGSTFFKRFQNGVTEVFLQVNFDLLVLF
jgi:hypothetical protein